MSRKKETSIHLMNFNISYFLSKNWILIHMYVGILQMITLVDCSTQFIDAWGTKDICFSIARYHHASLTTESNLILPDATTVAPSSAVLCTAKAYYRSTRSMVLTLGHSCNSLSWRTYCIRFHVICWHCKLRSFVVTYFYNFISIFNPWHSIWS